MTATERLRALLDERGVEWKARPDGVTEWLHDGMTCKAVDRTTIGIEHLTMFVPVLTPEQAVEATLGRGTCMDFSKYVNVFECSECGFSYDFITTPRQAPRYCPNCGRKVVE